MRQKKVDRSQAILCDDELLKWREITNADEKPLTGCEQLQPVVKLVQGQWYALEMGHSHMQVNSFPAVICTNGCAMYARHYFCWHERAMCIVLLRELHRNNNQTFRNNLKIFLIM